MPKKTVKKKGRPSAWKDSFYVEVYDLARQGMKNGEIAKAIGVSLITLKKWIKERPALKEALRKARKGNEEVATTDTFMEYVYQRLPAPIQALWDEISAYEEEDNSVRKIELLLKDKGKQVLQHLYVHALISSNFNASEACRRLNISTTKVRLWMRDPHFAQLIEEVMEHKKNLFESALIGLVKSGDTSAIIFANRTMNRDRGYGDKTEHVHTHSGGVLHGHVDVDKLPLELRRQLLEATREQERIEGLPPAPTGEIIDVDFEEEEDEVQ